VKLYGQNEFPVPHVSVCDFISCGMEILRENIALLISVFIWPKYPEQFS